MTAAQNLQPTRQLYLVLSPQSLPYARFALQSLWGHSVESLHLHLITDSTADKDALSEFMNGLPTLAQHSWSVFAEHELEDREAERFNHFPNLRNFRRGHPCWRKITDPLLLAAPGSEMVLLDPDLFFPNSFNFETTPAEGLLLMWQKPNCLLPNSVVTRALQSNIRLANHVDIGVAHWRGPDDMDWLEWLIGSLGGSQLPRMMHVEAIVWSALAMRMGGGYLDANYWHCWQRTQTRRVLRLLKVSGTEILKSEPWQTIKCFHGGGEAKWWIPPTIASGFFKQKFQCLQPGLITPFIELTPAAYHREQTVKRFLQGVGYYTLFRNA
jgi:hypothetical protein